MLWKYLGDDWDILCLQETTLLQSNVDSIHLPKGYRIHTPAQPSLVRQDTAHHGIAVVYRTHIPLRFLDLLKSPYIVPCKIGELILINVYLPPEYSSEEVDEIEEDFSELIALLSAEDSSTPICVVGDLNARTGTVQTDTMPLDRSSPDRRVSTRGRRLLGLLSSSGMIITNGITSFPKSGGVYFIPTRRLLSRRLLLPI